MKKILLLVFVYFALILTAEGSIKGVRSVCVGDSTSLSDNKRGGTWYTDDQSIATVRIRQNDTSNNMCTIRGINAGTANIGYIVRGDTIDIETVTVNPKPQSIIGANKNICLHDSVLLGNSIPGGQWRSSSRGFASINISTGLVAGLNPGSSLITYTLPSGCSTTTILRIDSAAALNPIIGSKSVCFGLKTVLTDTGNVNAGIWSSSNATIGSIDAKSGIVEGLQIGTVTIAYTDTKTGCKTTTQITVNDNPAKINGTDSVCIANTITLSDSSPNGTWSSSTPLVLLVGSSGSASGRSTGTSTVTYTLLGCTVTKTITVKNSSLPAAITGPSNVVANNQVQLSDLTQNGLWNSSDNTVATVGTSGIVTGIKEGTAIITITTSAGCFNTVTITITPSPMYTYTDVYNKAKEIIDSDKATKISVGRIMLKDTVVNVYNTDYQRYKADSISSYFYRFFNHGKINEKKLNRLITRDKIDTSVADFRKSDLYKINRAGLNIINGYINYARVNLKGGNKDSVRFVNNHVFYPIPFAFYRNDPNVLLFNSDDKKCVNLHDILDYVPRKDRSYYIPNDTSIDLNSKQKNVLLHRSIDLNSNIDFRIYTDLLGLINKQNNGIVQANATANIPINSNYAYSNNYFNNSYGIVLLKYVQPSFNYSKFANQSNALVVTDSTQPIFLSDSQRVALYQMSYLELGLKLNFWRIIIGQDYFDFNLGINYNFSNIQVGNNANLKTYNTFSWFEEFSGELLNIENFGMDFSVKAELQNNQSTNLQVYGFRDIYFVPEICMFYYPGSSVNNKIFLKLKVDKQIGSSTESAQNILDFKREFFSLQIGYSAKLKI